MNLSSAPEPPCVDHGALQVPLAALYSIIFVLGLVGNLVALWVFFCVHAKKNSVRVFLINVALADLLLVACLPFRILYHSRGNAWDLDPRLCRAVGNLFYMNMYISVTLLGLISVDRYLKLHRRTGGAGPGLRSRRWSSLLCAAVWVVSFTLSLVLLMSNNKSEAQSNRCFHYRQLLEEKWKAYINISVLLLFWTVFVALVVSYAKIALSLLRTSQAKPHLPNAARYARTARKSFFILFLFTVCFVPYHVVRVFYIKTQITRTPCRWRGVADRANEVALLFSALNSCLDPVMYFLLSSSVRKEVMRLVNGAVCARDPGAGAGVSGSSSTADGNGGRGKASARFTESSRTQEGREESNMAAV